MAHYEPPHQDLCCLQIQLLSSLVVKKLSDVDADKTLSDLDHIRLLFMPVETTWMHIFSSVVAVL